jgi:hypothetical protein
MPIEGRDDAGKPALEKPGPDAAPELPEPPEASVPVPESSEPVPARYEPGGDAAEQSAAAAAIEEVPAVAVAEHPLAVHRLMLRLAVGTAGSFTLAEALDWELSFLISVLVVQLLAAMPAAPSLAQGVGVMAVFGATTYLALITSGLLAHMPVLLTIAVGAMLFVAFFLQASGRAGLVATLLLISFGIVPVVAVQSPDIASAIAFFIFRSGVVAVLWVWLVFALFPSVAPPGAQRASVAAAPEPPEIMRRAAIDAAILLPVIVLAMTFSIPAVVLIVLTVTAVLRQHSLATGRRVALSLLLGNLLGGASALIAYNLLGAVPTLGFLASLLLLIGLLFSQRIARGGAAAPLFVTGLITFLILFGMGVAPLFDEPGATFAQRLFNIGVACVYAFAALALLDIGTQRERPLRVRSAV